MFGRKPWGGKNRFHFTGDANKSDSAVGFGVGRRARFWLTVLKSVVLVVFTPLLVVLYDIPNSE